MIDLRTFYLPDTYILLLTIAAIARYITTQSDLMRAVWGVVIGTGGLFFLWAITRGKGIGFGDVKLMIPLGIIFGVKGIITLLFIAFVVGGMVGVFLLISKKATMKTAIPFGPYLAGVAILLLIFPNIINRFFFFLGI